MVMLLVPVMVPVPVLVLPLAPVLVLILPLAPAPVVLLVVLLVLGLWSVRVVLGEVTMDDQVGEGVGAKLIQGSLVALGAQQPGIGVE